MRVCVGVIGASFEASGTTPVNGNSIASVGTKPRPRCDNPVRTS